jgi:hypothetical protein
MVGGVYVLPVFEGYTVDERLGEFRKVSRETGMEFIPFDSEEGEALWLLFSGVAQ